MSARYDLRQEPYEAVPHVRICAGDVGQAMFLPCPKIRRARRNEINNRDRKQEEGNRHRKKARGTRHEGGKEKGEGKE